MSFETVVFDDLDEKGWVLIQSKDNHWKRGFAVPRMLLDSEAVVQICNLKTHRYGGHFTLSLKNSVGFAAKQIARTGYNYMTELHSSPDQRTMIAEINRTYAPGLVVMDGVEAFTNGGPDRGKVVRPEVILASRDRIALDAVGVAILRLFGTTPEVSQGRVFEQAQIARAVELELGARRPQDVRLRLNPKFADAYNSMGVMLATQGNMDEAISLFQKSIAVKPDFSEAYNNLGLAYKQQGNIEKAIAMFQKAIQINADNIQAKNMLDALTPQK